MPLSHGYSFINTPRTDLTCTKLKIININGRSYRSSFPGSVLDVSVITEWHELPSPPPLSWLILSTLLRITEGWKFSGHDVSISFVGGF